MREEAPDATTYYICEFCNLIAFTLMQLSSFARLASFLRSRLIVQRWTALKSLALTVCCRAEAETQRVWLDLTKFRNFRQFFPPEIPKNYFLYDWLLIFLYNRYFWRKFQSIFYKVDFPFIELNFVDRFFPGKYGHTGSDSNGINDKWEAAEKCQKASEEELSLRSFSLRRGRGKREEENIVLMARRPLAYFHFVDRHSVDFAHSRRELIA
jgi:hypothetical protein